MTRIRQEYIARRRRTKIRLHQAFEGLIQDLLEQLLNKK